MTISRMGISSLMGYENGGDVNTGTQNNTQQGLNTLSPQTFNPFSVDVDKKAKEYQQVLQSTVRPPTRPSFFDLASDIGAALLAQPAKERFPSIGRSIGIGFQNFKQELDAKNKAIDEQMDKIALQSVGMALGDKQKSEQNYNDLLYKQLLNSIDPDRGTAVTYGKKMEDGTMIDASVIEMESLPEEHGAGEMGTTKLLKKYLKDTPYMTIDAKFTKEF